MYIGKKLAQATQRASERIAPPVVIWEVGTSRPTRVTTVNPSGNLEVMPRQSQEKEFRCLQPTMSCNPNEIEIRDKLLRYIKHKKNNRIKYYLEKLKKEPQLCTKFTKANGLAILVDLLHYRNGDITNLAISLLGNICRNTEARDQVRGTTVIRDTLWILNNLADENLQCRACRLIGNLSECSWYAKKLWEEGAVDMLAEILRSGPDPRTAIVAVRAVRIIWTNHEDSRKDIQKNGVINSISTLFSKVASKKSSSTKYVQLVDSCLTAMREILSTLNDQCALQMRGDKDHSTYRFIIKYCRAKNQLAIKCFFALCQIPECRPLLANLGGVECIIDLIKQNEVLPAQVLSSLCLFCREAVNRARIRHGRGIEVMLDVTKNVENTKYHPMMLHALALFLYDHDSISIMVKNGLLEVLTEKLRIMAIDASATEVDTVYSTKRPRESSPYSTLDKKHSRTSLGRFSLDYPRDDASPTSSSSPQIGFSSMDCDPDDADENYSSVCSDTEWPDVDSEAFEEVESSKSYISFNDDDSPEIEIAQQETQDQLSRWTLELLNVLSLSSAPIHKLAEPDTIEPLVAYTSASQHPKALQILTRIVKNGAYFESLILQGFVFRVDRIEGSEQYLRHFCELAETGGSIGQLSAILMRGSKTQQVIVAVSVPFLIKSKTQLRILLHNNGGLSLILAILADIRHDSHEKAIWSICQLANRLSIRAESFDRSHLDLMRRSFGDEDNFGDDVKQTKVTFVLDDGTSVDACRRSLCRKSDVFMAMLEGHFFESGKRRVRLRNTSKEGLVTLLLAVNGATYEDRTIESLLDAMLLADKFLMVDIAAQLTECSIANLNHENFSRAWKWARSNECSYDLRTCCVKRFLTSSMSRLETVRAFQDFSVDDHFSEFLEEVTDIIGDALRSQ